MAVSADRRRPSVATIGHRFPDAAVEAEALRLRRIEVRWLGGLDRPAALTAAADATGILLGVRFGLDADAIRRLPACRVIVRYGVGVDNVDVAAASAAGIVVCNVPTYGVEEVATHSLALLLLFARRLDLGPAAVRGERWAAALTGVTLPRLSRRTLGVVGAGRIGQAVIERARAFWGRILATDPIVSAEALTPLGAEKVELDTLLAESDFVTLHLPSGAATRGLISADRLARMKPGAVLVNCSRGDVVDEAALERRLREGALLGAGLDVFASEPPRPDGVVAAPNVWPTPHVAWLSEESVLDLRRLAAEEAGRVIVGEAPLHPVPAS